MLVLVGAVAGCGWLPGRDQGSSQGSSQGGAAPVATPEGQPTPAPALPSQAGAGQAQRYVGQVTQGDQRLEYQVNAVVTQVECGRAEIVEENGEGVDPTVLPATGQFCIVRYDVDNPSEVNGALAGAESLLVDPGGTGYPIDREATFLLASSERRVAGQIVPPGGKTSEALVFDVPVEFAPVQVQLRSAPEDQPLVVGLAATDH